MTVGGPRCQPRRCVLGEDDGNDLATAAGRGRAFVEGDPPSGEDARPGRQVWWSYWDRCLWTEGDFWSRINYIHRNPVKHGYAETPEQWAHSSWSKFVDLGPGDEAAMGLARFAAPRQLPNDP